EELVPGETLGDVGSGVSLRHRPPRGPGVEHGDPQVLQVSMGLGLMAQPGEAQGGGETLGRVDGYDECPHTGLGRRDAEGSGDRGLADPSATGDQEGPGHRTASMPSLRLAATSAGVYTPNR